MTADGTQANPSEWELIVGCLIARVRRSQWSAEMRRDAEHFRTEGYVPDVALAMAAKYWLG